jgi:hypothetical protein
MEKQVYRYEAFDGSPIEVELVAVVPGKEKLVHATPRRNVPSIQAHGLLIGQEPNKSLMPQQAVFLTEFSDDPTTGELFRFYDDWAVVVIDLTKIPDHRFYRDFFAAPEMERRGLENRHVMCLEPIPPEAISKVITFDDES